MLSTYFLQYDIPSVISFLSSGTYVFLGTVFNPTGMEVSEGNEREYPLPCIFNLKDKTVNENELEYTGYYKRYFFIFSYFFFGEDRGAILS